MDQLISAAQQPTAPAVKDGSTQTFKEDVIDASMEGPVVVDFWAPWCGPCKTLGPALEKAVKASNGRVRMVKIDIDQNQALAAQMRIQSIPAVYAFFQGQPVDGFVGALPESQIKAFIDKLSQLKGGDEKAMIEEVLGQAEAALAAGDLVTAQDIYTQLLQHDPNLAAAIAGLARVLAAQGDTEGAKSILDQAPAAAGADPAILAVRRQLELAEASSGATADVTRLEAALAADPDDHQARIDLAMAHYAAGDKEAAVEALIESIRRDRAWNEEAARQQLLKFFEAWGPTDPATVKGRRRLSSVLFA